MQLVSALNGIFLALALSAGLFVTSSESVFFGPFLIFSVLSFVYGERGTYLPALLWILAICSGFLLPVSSVSFLVMGTLLLFPAAGLTAKNYKFCIPVLILLALNLIAQKLLWPTELFGYLRRASWPLADPNNAATIMGVCTVLSIGYLHRTKKITAILLSAIFTMALLATESRGGILSTLIGLSIYFSIHYRIWAILPAAIGTSILMFSEAARESILGRLEIWQAALPHIDLIGHGMGTFHSLYPQIRTETETAGQFIHNDLIQFGFELGLPSIFFIILFVCIAARTTKQNATFACALFTVSIHSLVNYPFYVPSISLLSGIIFSQFLTSPAASALGRRLHGLQNHSNTRNR